MFEQHRTTAANAMQEIFQHTEKVKKDVMAKVSEQNNVFAQIKGEVANMQGEVKKVEYDPKPPEVTMEDLNIMKRMIFEIKDFTTATDSFVR